MVKVWSGRRMFKCPVRQRSGVVLDDGRQPQRKPRVEISRRQLAKAHLGVELEFFCRGAHSDSRIKLVIRKKPAVTIAHEGVRRPLSGRPEVEFVIRRRSLARHKDFATRVLPEPLGDARRARRRNAQPTEVSVQHIADRQYSIRGSDYARPNTVYGLAARLGVTDQLDGADRWGFHHLPGLTQPTSFART